MFLLHEWLNMPHMRRFYQKAPITPEEVKQKYLPRTLPSSPTRCHLAVVNGSPVGKLQCYRNADFPENASEIGTSEGISIDLFIGEPTKLRQGPCGPILRGYLSVVTDLFPDESPTYVCHDQRNEAAIACSKSVGFRQVLEVIEGGCPCVLLVTSDTGVLPISAP
ncbi:MAG: GNAT family N-acetyltransferase [Actinomycetota bacterium]|nr:acetyltransferase [Actinomycetota bacterium]